MSGTMGEAIEVSVLGRLRARVGEREIDLGPRKQQVVLAALLTGPNRLLSFDALTSAVWGGEPPASARKNLHVYVHNLRCRLREAGAGPRIANRDHGYAITIAPGELDSLAFEELARAGARTADATVLRQALDLWRGPAFEQFTDVAPIADEAQALHRRYLTVFEAWAEATLPAHAAQVIDEIEPLISADPLRERLRVILVTALQHEGRPAQALTVLDDYRRALARELGLSPSVAISRLQDEVLAEAGPGPGGAPRRVRRPVGFVGRALEAAALMAELRPGGETVIVTGPIGVGKTALALRCAHDLADAYPDGQFVVELGDRSTQPGPLRTLLRDVGARAGTDPATTWQAWAARHRALVILDDAPDEPAVLDLLPRAGECAVIVTARAHLPGVAAAHRLDLGPLSPAEGVELLARHLGAGRVERDPAAAAEIVEATGGLPLGIVAAAARLASLRHVPLREYSARLRAGVLDELRLRERLDAALGTVPGARRADLVALAGHGTPAFTLADAAQALGTEPDAAALRLEHLVEANLVTAPETEVSAHEVVYAIPVLLWWSAQAASR